MPRRIKIFDTTLRDGEQSPGCSMDINEKIEVAKALESMGVDIIEAGFAIASQGDFLAIEKISKIIKNSTVASLARATKQDIDAAFNAIKGAVSPRIHTFIATSPVHMQYKLKMKPDEVLERAVEMVKYAVSKCSDVEFSAEDACRTDKDFLAKIVEATIKAGAKVINIPDTVGYNTPDEIKAYIKYLFDNVKGIENVEISTHCHNDLGMAVANSIAAISEGASQIECSINGIGERAGNAALEEIVMALKLKANFLNVVTNIDESKIYRTSKLIQSITGVQVAPTKPIVGGNAFAHESGIHQHGVLSERTTYEIMSPQSIGIPNNKMVLGKHSGKHALKSRLDELGFEVTSDELTTIFDNFKILADKKKIVKDADIIALLSKKNLDVDQKYSLSTFVINSGNKITSTAIIKLLANNEEIESVALGQGPIDAVFKAINNVVGEFILEDYSIHAVTDGGDAQGEAIVKLKKDENSEIITGRGVSTDIVEASIKAYLSAINKFLA